MSGVRSNWKWIAAAGLLVAAAAAAAPYVTSREAARPVMRVSLPPPENAPYEGFPEISPDGSRVAFCARGPSGRRVLWIRALDAAAPVPIGGTDGATDPFWSPDSRVVGFFAQGKMKRVSAELSAAAPVVQTLTDTPDPRGGAWGRDGMIVFARNVEDGLYRVPAAGGEVSAVTTVDRAKQENSHRWPQFLPDGRHFIFLARSSAREHQGIYVGTLGSPDRKLLVRTPLNAMAVSVPRRAFLDRLFGTSRGYLLFVREEMIVAQPFDLNRLELTGGPVPIVESVGNAINRGIFSVSKDSSLIYRTSFDEGGRMAWFDRAGKLLATAAASGNHPRLSPDAKQVAFDRRDAQSGAGEIWLEDVSRRVMTRLTTGAAFDWIPVWSPDGSRVAFASNRDVSMDLFEASASASEPERLILKSDKRKTPTDWSRDGQFLIFAQEESRTGWDLWALPMAGERKPFVLLQSEFNENQGVLSPDGKWLAYVSDEAGANQVYVQAFTDRSGSAGDGRRAGGKWRVSADGGMQPRWRADGRELFYLNFDRKIVSVPIVSGQTFETGATVPLFATSIISDFTNPEFEYDVTADGSRFVITTVPESRQSVPLMLILNWTAALPK